MKATAVAHPNVALAKYWGKRDVPGNVPATPSVSVSLGGLETRTTVAFDEALGGDELELNGSIASGEPLARVSKLLDEVRALAGHRRFARVVTRNDFPTASGLASSASGFAALARAATAAAAVHLDDRALSRVARRASASAARSVFGGFVALGTEDDAAAEPLEVDFPIAIVVAAVTLAAKDTSSTAGMAHCRATSPYYGAWVDDAPKVAAEVRAAIVARDLPRLGRAAEASALRMHACMLASDPALLYWAPATIDLLHRVRALRAEGVSAWATIDAGPHVKVVCAPADAARVVDRLAPAAVRTIVAHVGGAARVLPEEAS
ncbi:MAG: diphosphomevalonate decarboxylase [Deltaproteobacteria bacterium]|nr:diphosphomevalonate decarboxylase [Deltaproteobacteria bacterium]